jgi:arylsulfatase A-like enzyme/Tfp pilus assembly protein PilF
MKIICQSKRRPLPIRTIVGLALSATLLTSPRSHLEPARTARPSVIFITVDTLRPDHLGCYGDARIRTPNIDRLAADGARFTQAYTPVPITLPAHTVIFTGKFPMATGMHDFSGNKLPATAITLAKLLRENGYTTAAFVGGAVLDSRFGLNQGFDTYFDHFDFSRLDETKLDQMKRPGNQVVDEALTWLTRQPAQPFFLWVHLYDPHYPYAPPEPFASRYRGRPYDGEIAFADAQVGRLLDWLRARSLYTPSVIVLAADHGEGLGEHGERTHGFFIYNSTLHVPLLIRIPGVHPRVVQSEVSLADVMPTVLDALSLSIPQSVQGRSLLREIQGQRHLAGASLLYSETYLPLLHFGWSQLRGLQWQGLKYIDAPRPEFYDTRTDPLETKNLFQSRKVQAAAMHARLNALIQRFTPSAGNTEKELTDPALLERLRSLGYAAVSGGHFANSNGRPLPDPKDRIHVYETFSEAMEDGQRGRYQESLRKLEEVQKADPALMPAHYLAALDYYRLRDYRRAAASFQAALRLDPKFALASYYLGLTRVQMGDFDGAITAFQEALKLDPTNFSAAYNLGATLVKKKRVDDALREFQRAVEINPEYAQAYEALGELYLYQGRAGDAARALERAIRLAPSLAKAHYDLGRAYQLLGRGADAEREFSLAKGSGAR